MSGADSVRVAQLERAAADAVAWAGFADDATAAEMLARAVLAREEVADLTGEPLQYALDDMPA